MEIILSFIHIQFHFWKFFVGTVFLGMETSSLVSDADLLDDCTGGGKRIGDQQANSAIIPGLSAREKNQLKRKARTGSRLESQNSIQSNATVRTDCTAWHSSVKTPQV